MQRHAGYHGQIRVGSISYSPFIPTGKQQRYTCLTQNAHHFYSDPIELNLVNFAVIHCLCAKRYKLKILLGYMMTILKNYKNQNKDFKKIDVIEP